MKTRYCVFIIVLILFAGLYADSADSKDQKLKSIPYPNRGLYLESGITGSIGVGMYRGEGNFFNNAYLFQWQGEGSYYYTPFLSAGTSAKIVAGEPTDSSTQVENRFLANIKLHKRSGNFAAFVGFSLGLYNLDFSKDLADSGAFGVSEQDLVVDALMEYILEAGSGWVFYYPFAITMGVQLEQVAGDDYLPRFFKGGEYRLNESVIRTLVGVNLDMMKFWKDLQKLSKGAYVSLEFQYAAVDDNTIPRRKYELAVMIGASIGF